MGIAGALEHNIRKTSVNNFENMETVNIKNEDVAQLLNTSYYKFNQSFNIHSIMREDNYYLTSHFVGKHTQLGGSGAESREGQVPTPKT